MNQLALSFEREAGALMGERCTDTAARVAGFDPEAASDCILEMLRVAGPLIGEDLTDLAMRDGHRPHDARAFGPIYAKLARDGLIRCVGYCARSKGHGTAGGRMWELA